MVIGGSSVLDGTGQAHYQMWTDKLRKSLGDEYQINLGYWGATPQEIGGAAAEILARTNPARLFVRCSSTGRTFSKTPDGELHRYFFWDAYYKNLLPADTVAKSPSPRCRSNVTPIPPSTNF